MGEGRPVVANVGEGMATGAMWSSATPLHGASPEAGQRWREFVGLSADFAFETDGAGNLVFLSQIQVLGWQAAILLGRPGSDLLATERDWFDPFAAGPPFRNLRVWLNRADGGTACVMLSAAPVMSGRDCTGMRGVGRDVTVQEREDAKLGAALRRGEVMDQILWQMRQEVLASRMMQAVLEGLSAALGASGAVVLDLLASTGPAGVVPAGVAPAEVAPACVMHQSGSPPGSLLPGMLDALQPETPDPAAGEVDGHPILTCPSYTRFGGRAGLCVWRAAGSTAWTEDDARLTSSVTSIIRVVLEHEAIQREMALQARTDPLTGLLNRRSFVEEVRRRIDRLDRDEVPGTLMYMALDHFKMLNDRCGQEVGDAALVLLAGMLRAAVRPADLVARLGGDEFALWLDGSDELTAAERADQFRLDVPLVLAAGLPPLAPAVSASIGIAARHPHVAETLEDVMRRADSAMSAVKRAGRGHWQVAPTPTA